MPLPKGINSDALKRDAANGMTASELKKKYKVTGGAISYHLRKFKKEKSQNGTQNQPSKKASNNHSFQAEGSDDAITREVAAYAFGHCEEFLERVSQFSGVSKQTLTPLVADLLQNATRRGILGIRNKMSHV